MDQKPEDYISSSMAKNSTFPDQINPMMQQNNMIFDIPSNYIEVSNNNNLGFMEMLGFQDHHDFSYPTSIWDLVINDYHQVVVPVPPPPSLQVSSLSQTHTQSQPPPLLSPASEVVNTPVTPNSSVSISSSSAEGSGAAAAAPIPNHHDQQMRTESEKELQEDQENTKQLLKPKKKNQKKKPKEARYAFKTKSEVEHLDDGYRWRKYGQKAVKNSPFPRSYYRCTTPTCGVKKRIERSSEDPTIVVTTYEGSHTHPYPITGRGSLSLIGTVASEPSTPTTTFGDGCDPCGGGAGSSSFLMPQMLHYHQSQVQPHEQQQPPFYQQDPTANLNFSGTNANHQQQLHPQQPYFQQDSTTNLNFNGTNPNVNVNPMTSLVNLFQERRFCPPSTRDGGLLQDILPSKMLIKNPIPKQG